MLTYKIRNTLLLMLVVLTLLSSCHKDDQVQPVLQSFGPTTVKHGETMKFIGVGLNQVTDIIMPVDVDVPSSAFITHTSTLIEIAVPEESMVGYVTLKTPKGDLTTKTAFGAAYQIGVASYTPAAKPGTNITINGDFLNYVKQVTFAQKQTVTEFVSQSVHELVVKVPMAAQTGPIVLTDLAKTPQLVDQDANQNTVILNVTLPSASSFSPPAGVEQTQTLTIAGTDLDLVTEIDFPISTGSVKLFPPFANPSSATQITLTVPSTAVTGPLIFVAPSGVKVTTPPVTVLEPIVTAMTTGRSGVDNVTITGSNLGLVSSITFTDGTVVNSASFVSQSEASIVVAIPANANPGTLQLTTKYNFKVSVPNFNVTLPAATAFSPSDAASQTPGATLTITGTDLDLVGQIKFPGVSTPVTSFNLTGTSQIDVVIPPGTTGGTVIFITNTQYSIPVALPFGNQLTLLATIFDDAVHSPFGKGGWGTPDIANTENPRIGTISIKSTFTSGYSGGGQFGTWGNTPLSTSGASYVAFSIYGGTGTNGKTLIVNFNGGPQAFITVDEGKWKDVKVALSSIGSPAAISEISFQDGNWSGVVYIDQIGLK